MLDTINFVLTLVIIVLVIAITGFGVYMYLSSKNKKNEANEVNKKRESEQLPNATREDIMNFLPFDTIEDDMIIQNSGERFTMLLECKGINYYLMSEAEKISVEEVFIQLLNSLKYPIQIYIQTRTVSLDDSIELYQKRLATLENGLNEKVNEFRILDKQGADQDKLFEVGFDIEKKENVVEYARDLISNIKMMTNNHNVLQKKYYISVSYHISEAGLVNNFNKAEMRDLAYTELTTKLNSIGNALSACGIESHILDSNELAEVMYIAINRDDSDIMSFEKALSSEFFGLYSTAKDPAIKRREMRAKV